MAAISAVEFRSVIRFLVLRGKCADAIMKELRLAYDGYSPCSTVYFWIKELKNGRFSREDGQSTEEP